MTKQFVVGDLKLKRTRIPGVVEIDIIGVDEGEFLIYTTVYQSLEQRDLVT